jgi:hypothetical protein
VMTGAIKAAGVHAASQTRRPSAATLA